MRRARRIVYPSDFSSTSLRAFKIALQVAKTQGAQLVIVHVLAPIAPIVGDDYVANPQLYADVERAAQARGRRQIERLVSAARRNHLRAVGLLLEGAPATQIVRVARSRHADMIVMGTHGRTGLARFVLGSVAGRVIATAPCPVLAVRAA